MKDTKFLPVSDRYILTESEYFRDSTEVVLASELEKLIDFYNIELVWFDVEVQVAMVEFKNSSHYVEFLRSSPDRLKDTYWDRYHIDIQSSILARIDNSEQDLKSAREDLDYLHRVGAKRYRYHQASENTTSSESLKEVLRNLKRT